MSSTMNPDLSSNAVLILQTMWELKALGTHAVHAHHLASRLPSVPKTETAERLEQLKVGGLITITKGAEDDLVALSAFGAAFVRQLQDRQLGDLTRGS